MTRRIRCVRTIAVLVGLLATASPLRSQDEAGDLARLVEALGLASGQVIAEIGAGDGALTIGLAKHIGPDGRVFTTELGDDRLRTLRGKIDAADVTQVEVLEAGPTRTNLAQSCCDAIVMRDVYHHFRDPSAMNASLLASLKPGGRLAILDFAPSGKDADTPAGRSRDGHHGVGRQTVSRELTAAGFSVTATNSLAGRRFLVVAHRP